jgi:uncharacterized SAM-binding protein YcdF (DUF218 family)
MADGIVALTGGAQRIEVALHLLAEGRGGKLLISGAGGGADLRIFALRAGLDAEPFAARVTLDYNAATTHGNAVETAAWVRDNRIGSLIVVTAYYHMPRAMLELSTSLQGVALYAFPVPRVKGPGPPGALAFRLLAEEYCKYLVVYAGASGWLPARVGRSA